VSCHQPHIEDGQASKGHTNALAGPSSQVAPTKGMVPSNLGMFAASPELLDVQQGLI
jgi:hypothetical protein